VDDSHSCPECGTDLGADAGDRGDVSPNEDTAPTTDSKEPPDEDGVDTDRAIVAGVMGMTVGAVVAFAFSNVGGQPIWFVITLAGVGYFLYSTQETSKQIVGMGLYLTALWMPLVPIIIYIPLLAEVVNSGTGDVIWRSLWWIYGMFLYGLITLIIGLILAGIGYFIRKGEWRSSIPSQLSR
jgi:hypothetical protein